MTEEGVYRTAPGLLKTGSTVSLPPTPGATERTPPSKLILHHAVATITLPVQPDSPFYFK